MKIHKIAVEYRRKFNLGNYESMELGITMWGSVDEDEDPEAVAQMLWYQAKASVKEQAMPVLKGVNHKAEAKYQVAGMEVE